LNKSKSRLIAAHRKAGCETWFLLWTVNNSGEAITVYKDPNCGCGTAWVNHVRENRYKVKSVNSEDMAAIKKRLGLPETLQSCHPSVVEASRQVFEGHVPVAALAKLIA